MEKQNIIIYKTQDGKVKLSLYARDGSVWMNQNQIAELFDTSKQNISYHIINILEDNELDENSVVKNYLTTASDGKSYEVTFYSLDMILAIGFRVRSKRGTQFRQWEKRFYQKVRDLFKLSNDYDETDKATQMFFAETQNKLLFAVTNQTAAEIIVSRADAQKQNMGLTSWKGTIVRKGDVFTAKNYLTEDEIDTLNRLVVVFLESAELRAKNRQDITMDFWQENVDKIIEFNDKKLLKNRGSVSKSQMEKIAGQVYEDFNNKRKIADAQQADLEDLKQIEMLEKQIKENK